MATMLDSAAAEATVLCGPARTSFQHTVIVGAGWFLVLLGSVVAFGWFAEIPSLVQMSFASFSMKLNTAVCMALFGAGVLALEYRRPHLAAGCALAVAVVGSSTLIEYAAGVNLRLDELLRPAFLVEPGVPPGRMAPLTAALFTLAGVGLILLCARASIWRSTVAGLFASITAGVATATLIGHISRGPTATGWGALMSVAPQTAASFLVVAAALGALVAAREMRFPRWLPLSALIAGLACTLSVGSALFRELQYTHSLLPELVVAVGMTMSALMTWSLHARRQLEEQHDLLTLALARSEEARAERARLAAIVESSSEAIMSMNRATDIVTFNPAAEKLFGYSAAEICGRSVRTLIPPDRLAEFEESILPRLRRSEATRSLRTQRLRKDGSIVDVEVDIAPLRGGDGTPLGALSMTRDISERLAAEQLVRGVLEAAPDAVIVTDSDGRIMLVNRMAERMFGYARDALVGSGIERLIPASSREKHVEQRQAFMSVPTPRSMGEGRKLEGLRNDGSVFPVEISLNSFASAGRTLAVSAVRDITSRHLAEQRLRDSLQDKELLLKEIHHRVKNNLQVVASMLALQAARADDAQAITMLDACRQRVTSMAKVHEKLYGARDMQRVDLGDLLRDVGTMLLAGAPDVTLDVQLEDEPVVVDIETAFPVALIVNELVTNSLKHAFVDRSHGRITIGISRIDDERVHVQVQDDGVGGITRALLERKSGLGSTIVRTLARQLDCTMSLDSGPGTTIGLTFAVRRKPA